jgi:hypothetical protein
MAKLQEAGRALLHELAIVGEKSKSAAHKLMRLAKNDHAA